MKSKTIIGISWLHNRMNATSSGNEFFWESPECVDSIDDFSLALDSLISAHSLKNAKISLVIDSKDVFYQSKRIPLVNKQILPLVIKNEVTQNTLENFPIQWSFWRSSISKDQEQITLCFANLNIIHEIIRVFHEKNLILLGIYSPVSIIQQVINQTEDVVLGISTIEKNILFTVISNKNVIFARSIHNIGEENNRILIELQKTLLFLKERLNISCKKIIIFGNIGKFLNSQHLNLAIEENSVSEYFYATNASRLELESTSNLLPKVYFKDWLIKKITLYVPKLSIIFLLIMVLFRLVTSFCSREYSSKMDFLDKEYVEICAKIEKQKKINNDIEKKLFNSMTSEGNSISFVKLFYQNLGEIIPVGCQITDFSIVNQDTSWKVKIQGIFDSSETFYKEYPILKKVLNEGPFHLKIFNFSNSEIKLDSTLNLRNQSNNPSFTLEGEVK